MTIAEALVVAQRHQESGSLEQAEQIYRRVLQADPANPEAWCRLGTTCLFLGKLDEAVASLRQAVRHQPDSPDVYRDLGTALGKQGKLSEAVSAFEQALRLRPDDFDAHNNLGIALAQQGRFAEAVACYQRTLQIQPACAETYNNLGNAHAALRDWNEARTCYEHGLRLFPYSAVAHRNLGTVFLELGELDRALACFRAALRLRPDLAEAHNHLGSALLDDGKAVEALASFEQALRIDPDLAMARWNRARCWLLLGNFEQGWPEFEWRIGLPFAAVRSFRQPVWDGAPLAGRTILLYIDRDFGLGDTIQFIRYAALVKRRGGTVVVECQEKLIPLLATCSGIDRLVAQDTELPAFDVQASLLSLPRIFGTTLAGVPADIPYLSVDSERERRWRQRLESTPSFKIGIVWQGDPKYRWDRFRSIPLVEFAPLAQLSGISLFSLQVGHGTEQLAAVTERFGITDLADESRAFLDVAAIMKNLDLIIAPDTVLAHCAGALGVPVWLALGAVAQDWRWLREREDSPWYPTMRLFRQSKAGGWADVFERMAARLAGREPN